MNDPLQIILGFVLREGVKNYFEIVKHTSVEQNIHLYLDELNQIPEEYTRDRLEFKGFYNAVTIQDFPIRGSL